MNHLSMRVIVLMVSLALAPILWMACWAVSHNKSVEWGYNLDYLTKTLRGMLLHLKKRFNRSNDISRRQSRISILKSQSSVNRKSMSSLRRSKVIV